MAEAISDDAMEAIRAGLEGRRDWEAVPINVDDLRALLARIDAAEAALKVVDDERKKQSEFVAWLEDLAENPPAPTDALRKLFADYTDAISTGALITDLPRKEPSP